jgi:hypothetical protein
MKKIIKNQVARQSEMLVAYAMPLAIAIVVAFQFFFISSKF